MFYHFVSHNVLPFCSICLTIFLHIYFVTSAFEYVGCAVDRIKHELLVVDFWLLFALYCSIWHDKKIMFIMHWQSCVGCVYSYIVFIDVKFFVDTINFPYKICVLKVQKYHRQTLVLMRCCLTAIALGVCARYPQLVVYVFLIFIWLHFSHPMVTILHLLCAACAQLRILHVHHHRSPFLFHCL